VPVMPELGCSQIFHIQVEPLLLHTQVLDVPFAEERGERGERGERT
jgi:hypothetical protein